MKSATRALLSELERGRSVRDEFWMEADLDKLPAYLLIVGRSETRPGKSK